MQFVVQDPELGAVFFPVQRTTYRRQEGQSVPTVQSFDATGCIHPGTPEMVQLLPEEERKEDFIAVYTDFILSTGENDGGVSYSVPDRIEWDGFQWRVVRVKSWKEFGYCQALAVRVRDV